MLSILRLHARSWAIKAMFGVIIVVFVFFYGWTKFSNVNQADNFASAVSVNGKAIPMGLYRLFFQENYQLLSRNIKDPESRKSFMPFIERTTVNSLVNRQIRLDAASSLGVRISDKELSDSIKKDFPKVDGEEIKGYLDNLSYFKMRYGINLETLRREDLALARLQDLFSIVNLPDEDENSDNATWNFLEVEIDPQSVSDAKKVSQEFLALKGEGDWDRLAKEHKLTLNKKQGVKISGRAVLFSGRGTLAEYMKIFSLNSQKPSLDEPIELAGKMYVVLLKGVGRGGKEKTSDGDENKTESRSFLDEWLYQAAQGAKIKSYVSPST